LTKKKTIYKNSPLVETVFEIRFPGEPAIECKRDRFYGKVKSVYSNVLVPRSREGVAMPLEPYRFERRDGTGGVMLSLNKMAVYSKEYEGFATFKKETMRLLTIFGDMYQIKKLNRAGLRYINIIPYSREKDIIPLSNYVNVNVEFPKAIPSDFLNMMAIFVSKAGDGSITTRIGSAISTDRTKEVLILDFDYAREGNLQFDLVEKYLVQSHRHTKRLFEDLITEDYKRVMRGEIL
jgi:uncharacterized protein (TIGR04255 family)